MKAIFPLLIIALGVFYVHQNHPEVIQKLLADLQPLPAAAPSSTSATEPAPTLTVAAPPVAPVEPTWSPAPVQAPAPVELTPAQSNVKRWYLLHRAISIGNYGVSAIAAGSEIQILKTHKGECTVTDGRVTLKVSENSVSNEPPVNMPAAAAVASNGSDHSATTNNSNTTFSSLPPAPEVRYTPAVSSAPPENPAAHNARIQAQLDIIDSQIDQMSRRIDDLNQQHYIARYYGRTSSHAVSISRLQHDITRLNSEKMALARALK